MNTYKKIKFLSVYTCCLALNTCYSEFSFPFCYLNFKPLFHLSPPHSKLYEIFKK